MATNDEDTIARLCDEYAEVALTGAGWSDLLRRTAVASGGWATHFVVAELSGEIEFSLGGGLSQDILDEFECRGGTALGENPRAAVLTVRRGVVLSEADFIDEKARRKLPMYAEYYDRIDTPYCQIAHLGGAAKPVVVLLRGARQGLPSPRDKAVFEALLPHVSGAVRMRRALGDAALTGALDAFEAMGGAAFICDAAGRIRAATQSGEELLQGQSVLTARGGVLAAAQTPADLRLRDALARACRGRSAPPVAADIFPLEDALGEVVGEIKVLAIPPSRLPFDGRASCLVHVQVFAPGLALSRLTAAERAVCLLLGRGLPTHEIARARGVSKETIRSQSKAIYAKLEISGRAELAAQIGGRPAEWGAPHAWE